MKKILLMASMALALTFTACSNKEPVYVDPEFKGAPNWVLNYSDTKNTITAVGSAQKNAGNDYAFQKQEATANARDNLSQQIEVKVNNMFKSFKSTTGAGVDGTYDKATEAVSKQISSQTITGSKINKSWRSMTGTLYVQVSLNKDLIVKDIKAKTSHLNDNALFQKFLAEKAQKELSAEVN